MCGITGIILPNSSQAQDLRQYIRKMTSTLVHRGPDDGDTWVGQKDPVALGHRRLAILDLSPAGRQPMTSGEGRYTVVYNGEIYNYLEIRKELQERGHNFASNCDTEVLLAAFSEWGVESVKRFIGMFAFAIWDGLEKRLHLVRDRLGIKPLYYGFSSHDSAFVFGSELKALSAYPGFKNGLNFDALGVFFRHNYIPAPRTIYEQVFKVMPGEVVTLDLKDIPNKIVQKTTYWSAEKAWEMAKAEPFQGSFEEAVDLLEESLTDAVRLRLVTDVPLGAFLSGGIDSSTVVALMQAVSSRPVRTFSVGFREADYNEAPFAKKVANHLGTEHTELYITARDALELIPQIPEFWDEPFADSSQIPTLLISSLTRRHVTVALSGDGGDELFWGYPRYEKSLAVWSLIEKIPENLRPPINKMLDFFPDMLLDILGLAAGPIMERYGAKGPLSRISRRIQELLNAHGYCQFYGWANSHILPFGQICKEHDDIAPAFYEISRCQGEERELMALLDIITYLPDDILTKVDRASMAVALEARVPILDHRVVEISFRLPGRFKHRNGTGKLILRHLLYRYLPKDLVDRPKMGFGIPLGDWIRGPLREWAEELLSPHRIRSQGYLRQETVSRIWEEHVTGKCNHQYTLWNILMFQAWLERWGA